MLVAVCCAAQRGAQFGNSTRSTRDTLSAMPNSGPKVRDAFREDFGYSEHVLTDGPRFREHACKLGLEGVISKRIDRPYAPGDRGLWVKSKCLNREEFVVVGWTDPEGSRQHIGALLLGYYTDDGRLHYAGRAGTGMNDRELKRLAGVLAPLQVPKMPLAAPPPRDNRFGSPVPAENYIRQ